MTQTLAETALSDEFAIRIQGTEDMLLSNLVTGSFFKGARIRFSTQEDALSHMAKMVERATGLNAQWPHLSEHPTNLEVVRVRTLLSTVAVAAKMDIAENERQPELAF